ncbi:hypothetical protein [Mycolicibacterium sp.]|uniref:hypothetical protein n=1 Tax=Mycolicibacterium sp. TaxID=2320850 RepID=UPI0025D224BF|nr:hypothetical protein [Mycolicibacterium sp.]MCB9408090.1 hypothetical protein [Mycolicibacterium sp.]MCB9424194.1 hypothetical protein [Actinomycetota bacterium]
MTAPAPRGPLRSLIYASTAHGRTEQTLMDAVLVHASTFSRGKLLRLLFEVLWLYGDAARHIDRATGALERATGASSLARIDAAMGLCVAPPDGPADVE